MEAKPRSRVIDLDIDIGADAVDYKYVSKFWKYWRKSDSPSAPLPTKSRCPGLRRRCASSRVS